MAGDWYSGADRPLRATVIQPLWMIQSRWYCSVNKCASHVMASAKELFCISCISKNHKFKLRSYASEVICVVIVKLQIKQTLSFLYSWVCASWIYVNNCPTRCDYVSFIIYSAYSSTCFRWYPHPSSGAHSDCNYNIRYWSNRICYCPLTWRSQNWFRLLHVSRW